jgi:hypothetical protein
MSLIDRPCAQNNTPLGGVKGHDMDDISFARIPLATACPGSSLPC